MSYYHRRQAIRLQARAEGRALAETMGDEILTAEQIAALAQKAAAAARFRHCLTPVMTKVFTTAFIKAAEIHLREAGAVATSDEGRVGQKSGAF
jgi:hypothetical protein